MPDKDFPKGYSDRDLLVTLVERVANLTLQIAARDKHLDELLMRMDGDIKEQAVRSDALEKRQAEHDGANKVWKVAGVAAAIVIAVLNVIALYK